MAQPQAQAGDSSPVDSRTTTNKPATQAQGGRLPARNSLAWSAGPFGMMRRLSDDMDQLFDQLIGGAGAGSRGVLPLAGATVLAPSVDWMPPLQVLERDGKLIVQADLPGVAADDITVEVADGLLTISGERQDERELDDAGCWRTERRFGRFSRTIALPEGARVEETQASCRDGVLEITIPMPQSQQQRRTIDVQTTPRKETSGASSAANEGASATAGTT